MNGWKIAIRNANKAGYLNFFNLPRRAKKKKTNANIKVTFSISHATTNKMATNAIPILVIKEHLILGKPVIYLPMIKEVKKVMVVSMPTKGSPDNHPNIFQTPKATNIR